MTQARQTNPPCICGHPENEHEDLLGCAHRDRDGFSCPCAHVAGDATPPATPQLHDPWELIVMARDTFRANGHLNPHLRAAWEMAANNLDRMLGNRPSTLQPDDIGKKGIK